MMNMVMMVVMFEFIYIFDSEKMQRTKIDNNFICPLLEIRIMSLKEWWLNFNFEQKKILVGEVFPRKEKVPFFEGGRRGRKRPPGGLAQNQQQCN